MSILIKGMEMPQDGVYWCEIGVAGEIATITFHGEDRKSFHLASIPPHGRLIDADAFAMSDRMVGKFMMFGGEYVYTQSEIDNAPTIIPAEEGERHEN